MDQPRVDRPHAADLGLLKPTYSFFWYQNKVYYDLLRGGSFDFKLDYRFEHQTGGSWRKELGYGRPQ